MRTALAAFLAACTPAPSADSASSAAATEPHSPGPNIANDPQLIGHWRANANETRAEFGGETTPPAFTFGCDRDFLQIERIFSRPHGVANGAGASFNILLPRETIAYRAVPSAENPQRLWLAAPRGDFRLDAMVASEDGFAIQTAGDTTRFRYDPMLARVLANCRR